MADVKCPHCGSPYCNLEKKEDSFQETMRYYYCNGCKQRFRTVYKKPAASGTWLLTFVISSPRGEVEFYRNPDSSIYYRKKLEYYDEVYDRYESPKFSTHTTSPVIYVNGIDFFLRDTPDSSSVILKEIQVSPELFAKAIQNQAMRAIHLNNKSFNLNEIRNDALRNDVCSWLRATLHARELPAPKGGCYIATAVYGSYDCPQVWTLRRFRDNTLASTWYGRTFISLYYAVSPTLVKWFGESAWFQKVWRSMLDTMVNKLHRKGVESTPYRDRQ